MGKIRVKTFTETQVHKHNSTENIHVKKVELIHTAQILCEEEEWGSDTRAAEFVLNGTQESVVEREVV